ncbi:MAG: undecaprenyl/decaprenyl-phosphate alpha-N-acetylglucosaminyl 1-phosphate transferase [Candidatus Magasanikbacteria bacterium]|nr:undecaprenyl/decaprenyl-phosphate alpha-N-acetylglucosaminyl 1-phosphate transferase [Candidatus Magasanikbacteria bacterium]
MAFGIAFVISFLLAYGVAFAVRRIALRCRIVDVPDGKRKKHESPRPLLGGIAIYAGFFIVLFGAYFLRPEFFVNLKQTQLVALLCGSTILMFGGYLDDRYTLRARYQLVFPLLAALVILAGGVNLTHITNPFGGAPFEITRFTMWGVPFAVNALVFVWLMGLMYTTKILDGVDGLVGGVTAIGAVMIFLLTQSARFFQPDIGLTSLIFVGACLGFLVLNFPPAKLFLGEGGSLFTGFILGNLAIIAGSKIATTLLVMGLPMVDLAYTVYRRARSGVSPFKSDAGHLHFRLLQKGFTARRVVFLKYILAALFGISTLILQSNQKIIALLALACVSLALIQFAHRA